MSAYQVERRARWHDGRLKQEIDAQKNAENVQQGAHHAG
jgi:hypothetical protein